MPRIRCHYLDCVFLDEGYCSAAAVEIDPDDGCLTYAQTEDASLEEDWEEEEEIDEWDDEEVDELEDIEELEEDEDDLWEDEEEEF